MKLLIKYSMSETISEKFYNYWKQAGIALIFRRANASMSILRVVSMSKLAIIFGISTFMLETITAAAAMIIIALIWIALERYFRKERPHEQKSDELKQSWLRNYYLTSDANQKDKLTKLSEKTLDTNYYLKMILIDGGLYLTVIWSIIRTIFLIFAPTTTIPYFSLCLILLATVLVCALIIHQNISQEKSEYDFYSEELKKLINECKSPTQFNFNSTEYDDVTIKGIHVKIDEQEGTYILQDRCDGNFWKKPYPIANYLSIAIITTSFYFLLYTNTPTIFLSYMNVKLLIISMLLALILIAINKKLNHTKTEEVLGKISTCSWYFNALVTSIGFYCLIQWGMPFHYITGPIYIPGAILSTILFCSLTKWRNSYIGYVIDNYRPFIALFVGYSSAEMLFNTFFLFLGISIQTQFMLPYVITIKYLFMLTFASSYAITEEFYPSTVISFNEIVYRLHQGTEAELKEKGFSLIPT